MKILRAFTGCIAALALSAGMASAAVATWTTGYVTSVKVRSEWSVSGTTSSEHGMVLVVTLSTGATFAKHVLEGKEKPRQLIEMAEKAAASGKRLSIFADPERIIYTNFCTDYALSGCIQTTGIHAITMIEDMAINP